MSRLTPAGERVTWRMAGAERLGAEGGVPALINWDDPAKAPPFAPPLHPVGPVSLDHVEIGDPDGDLRRLLPVVDAVRVVPDGPATVHDVVVVTGDGQLLITAEALRGS